jgi:hypothetical protein
MRATPHWDTIWGGLSGSPPPLFEQLKKDVEKIPARQP